MKPIISLVLAGVLGISVSGCYREQPASAAIDLSEVPENVAFIVPLEGIALTFTPPPIGSSTDFTVHLVNEGPYPATKIEPEAELQEPFSFKGGAFPGTGGTCSTELQPSADCMLVLTYSPMDAGPHSQLFTLNYVNGVIVFPLEFELAGTSGATLSFSPSQLDFGMRAPGTSQDEWVTITNFGSIPAQNLQQSLPAALAPPFSFLGGNYPGTDGTCGASLGPSASCTIQLRFNPTDPGLYSDTLTLTFTSTGMPQTATLPIQGSCLLP